MRSRRRRCVLYIGFTFVFYIFWRLTSLTVYDDDKTALSALEPQHFAEDSRKGILYHHKTHDGYKSYHTADDYWVRTLLAPFFDELLVAANVRQEANWSVAHDWPNGRRLHPLFSPNIVRLLRRMVTARVVKAEPYKRGSQLKILLTLEGGQQVVFKPKRYDKDFVLLGTPYVGKDRHFAEIAGFHLSRLLLFSRTPLIVGRRIHFGSELQPVMTAVLKKTLFTKNDRFCFYGVCYYCTGPEYGACAEEDGYMEGAMLLHLPAHVKLQKYAHPWRRTYKNGMRAEWESKPKSFCENLLAKHPDLKGQRLMDMIDAAVFDFIIGNADRHHYETVETNTDSVMVLLDNGKGFGNPYTDEVSILAPLRQCCKLRWTTWKRLQELTKGVLSAAMERLMEHDPLKPVLTKLHLRAMDHRLDIVINSVHHCIERQGHSNVFIAEKH